MKALTISSVSGGGWTGLMASISREATEECHLCFEALLLPPCFVSLQGDWATALTPWCRNMEGSAAVHPRVKVFPRRAASISSASPDTTSPTRSLLPGVVMGSGVLQSLPASPSKVRDFCDKYFLSATFSVWSVKQYRSLLTLGKCKIHV